MLYIVQMEPNPGVEMDAVQKVLNEADDWHRLGSQYCWIIDTNIDATYWTRKLTRFAEPHGELFVCKLVARDRNGYKPKAFWDWLRKRG